MLPPYFFHFLKHIPVAKSKELPAADVVKLKCELLGVESRDFTPAHAKALLAFQESKGLSDWQPVTTSDADTSGGK